MQTFVWHFPRFCSGPLLISLYTNSFNLLVGKHKCKKFPFYADDTQVYGHSSQKNTCAAFEQLTRCFDDVKEWMSTSKFKLNPDKTEFILFASKRQRDKLKAWFRIDVFLTYDAFILVAYVLVSWIIVIHV